LATGWQQRALRRGWLRPAHPVAPRSRCGAASRQQPVRTLDDRLLAAVAGRLARAVMQDMRRRVKQQYGLASVATLHAVDGKMLSEAVFGSGSAGKPIVLALPVARTPEPPSRAIALGPARPGEARKRRRIVLLRCFLISGLKFFKSFPEIPLAVPASHKHLSPT